jgi:hypothetical protein
MDDEIAFSLRKPDWVCLRERSSEPCSPCSCSAQLRRRSRARAVLSRAADFNGIANNYPYVRSKARELLAKR